MKTLVLPDQLDLFAEAEDWLDPIDLGEPLEEEDLGPDQFRLDIVDDKPAYRVPTMAEVAVIPANGYRLVSTFSGCGGSCLGFRMAGFRTLLASEFVPAAADSYLANHPGVPLAVSDVRDLEPELVLARLGLRRGELDVLEGSPPCSSFSMAGKREDGWGEVKKYSDVKQRTDDLFFEFVRLVDGLRPRVVVAENVPGLLAGEATAYFDLVSRSFDRLGYVLWAKILNAAWYGVPQNRRRVILVAVRRDLGVQPAFPKRLGHGYSMREALASLDPPTERELIDVSIERFAIGSEWNNVAVGDSSERYFSLVRPNPDRPLPTLTQTAGAVGAASVVHPHEQRKFTARELRRLCSFPDDFVLTGSYQQQVERLGRAVPPLMMRAVAAVIRDNVLRAADAVPEEPEP